MKRNNIFGDTSMWRSIVSGFLATVLGILVTIGTARCQDEREKEQNKRDLTIMIIHDLDNTENAIKGQMESFRSEYDKAEYVMNHLAEIDSISFDTVKNAHNILLIVFDQSAIEFPQMAENIMKGNLDSWNTLSNVQFMQNVESCYSLRKKFNSYIVPKDIQDKANDKMNEIHQRLLKEEGQKTSEQLFREMISQLFATDEMKSYVSYFNWAIKNRGNTLYRIHQLNTENKWLMSVNDDELKRYVESTSKRAPADRPAVKKDSLIGTWEQDLEILKGTPRYTKGREMVLRKDNSISFVQYYDFSESSKDTIITHTCTYYGHWKLTDMDITLTFDSARVRPTEAYKDKFKEETIAKMQKETDEDLSPTVLSDIMIGTNEFSAMAYLENDKDNTILWRFIRTNNRSNVLHRTSKY